MFASFLTLALSYIRVVREELVVTVVTFFIRRNQHRGISLLLQNKLLSLLTAAEFLLLLFNLWRFWFLLVQTGVPLLVTEQLVRENLVLRTDTLLSLLTAAEFLLLLFNLWRFWFLLVQTGVPLLVTEQLVSENLLWELWRDTE